MRSLSILKAVKTVAVVGLALVATEVTSGVVYSNVEMGKDAYKEYNATTTVKEHFWSKPQVVYSRNGKPVEVKEKRSKRNK